MALVISLGRLYASPPANHTQAIVVAEYTRAMVQTTACWKMLNPQNPESQGISPAFLVAAKAAFAQLEKLRLRDSVDGIWVALSKETDVRLTKMATNTSSFGEAMLGIDIAMQYQAVIADRLETKSAQVRLTRRRAVVICAASVRKGLSNQSWESTSRCAEAKKTATDALQFENERLDREIESLQNES
jgi:hypothetical protein